MQINLQRIAKLAALQETPEIKKYIEERFGAGEVLGAGQFGIAYMLDYYEGENQAFHGHPGVLKLTTMPSELEAAEKLVKLQKGGYPADWHLPMIYEVGSLPFESNNPELNEALGITDPSDLGLDDMAAWPVDFIVREYLEPWEGEWGCVEGDALVRLIRDNTGLDLDDIHRKENIGYRPYGLDVKDLHEEGMPWGSTGRVPVVLDFVDEDLRI